MSAQERAYLKLSAQEKEKVTTTVDNIPHTDKEEKDTTDR